MAAHADTAEFTIQLVQRADCRFEARFDDSSIPPSVRGGIAVDVSVFDASSAALAPRAAEPAAGAELSVR